MRPLLPPPCRLPPPMRCPQVKAAYRSLWRRRDILALKRALDLLGAALLLPAALPVVGAAALVIKADSPGPVFFCQRRVTAGGRLFTIYKLRTMAAGSGGPLTAAGDSRVTAVGRFLRRTRLDELPQLWNVLRGEMSFVGPRPELPRYVRRYEPWMLPALLVPAGITSSASLCFRREEEVLALGDRDRLYREEILPAKMAYNCQYIRDLSLREDGRIVARTLRLMAAGRTPSPKGRNPEGPGRRR